MVLILCIGIVGVFYSPSRLGNIFMCEYLCVYMCGYVRVYVFVQNQAFFRRSIDLICWIDIRVYASINLSHQSVLHRAARCCCIKMQIFDQTNRWKRSMTKVTEPISLHQGKKKKKKEKKEKRKRKWKKKKHRVLTGCLKLKMVDVHACVLPIYLPISRYLVELWFFLNTVNAYNGFCRYSNGNPVFFFCFLFFFS